VLTRELDPRRYTAFFHEQGLQTPCLLIDLEMVAARYCELAAAMPGRRIYYAVKAQPASPVISTLAGLGSSFDVASRPELELVLSLGVPPSRISYGNTIKRERDVAYAYQRGVRIFAFDSQAELHKLARAASGAAVICRILVDNAGAQWPLSRKFGCAPDMAANLLAEARLLGLQPFGVSFHPGSQQLEPAAWRDGCVQAAHIFAQLRRQGVRLSLVNLGGGFPARYSEGVPAVDEYAKAIDAAIHDAFGPLAIDTMIEPGRGIAGDAGVLRSLVLLSARKFYGDPRRWVFLDVGRYRGLAETEAEAIHYPVAADPDRGGLTGRVVLAGPSCDGTDIIYERRPLFLPNDLRAEQDYVDFLCAGAYTNTYSAVGFNGMPPLEAFCFGGNT
jgi:ornithine decarboxylase